ncbi:short-chain dehydrogenase/reductase family 16C member 6 isoform X2 [Zeugodacus cucurbitae]|uniref:short-chain dehydrogenase/reductase family 16C member 6 isoform X2 n=1 Tax=Zeugodacus cucurbitae TaxID=28588 RepID=UPI0023D8F0CE|nr:short-chain dehydrogenase/reductase family 16C member 6 isoform X2 [Zeugodacus cucurbitae]
MCEIECARILPATWLWSPVQQVVWVTGAAGGLGKCIAAELAAKGCHVAVCDINFDLAVTTSKEIANKYGVKSKAYKVDVTKYDEIVELNEKLTHDIGAATILVNNAGLLTHTDQLNPTVPEIELMVKVNYLSHFLTNRVFLPNMKQAKRGHIVAICSITGLLTVTRSEPYCSAKTAVRTLMRVLRAELRLYGITGIGVTTVYPPFLTTHAGMVKNVRNSGYAKLYPLLKGEKMAQRIVHGMLRGEVEIGVPGFVMIVYRFIAILPSIVQDGFAHALAALKNY